MAEPTYHVMIRKGDASAEVEAATREVGGAASAGLHRHYYVSRADQTVVLATSADAPISRLLRERGGWMEPADPSP